MGDSKLKGPKWVGNIFQKFEAIYHEDTFKYVENQIQSVGKNVKKICADLLPASGHPDKHMAEDVAIEKIDDVSPTTSKSWQKNSGHASENQSPAAPNDSATSQVRFSNSCEYSCGGVRLELTNEAAVTSSDTGCLDESSSDIDYCHMESIDLHDKVQIQENCVNVEDSVLHAISRRVRKQRSYKKQMQDAFTSKKRLAKEYEQLEIWFGDLDLESSQKKNSDKHNSETHLAADSEWELL